MMSLFVRLTMNISFKLKYRNIFNYKNKEYKLWLILKIITIN